MRLIADSGLWSTGPAVAVSPLIAVLEVSGAVLAWTVDDPTGATHITFTDLSGAEWLWRVVGEAGHVALVSAVSPAGDEGDPLELGGIDITPGAIDQLRRLAVGHWLRRWWPASQRDGIATLDRTMLDVEVALLTADAQDFFFDDTLDSDVAELLAPHAASMIMRVRDSDPRVRDLVRAGAELAEQVGVEGLGWPELSAALDDSSAIVSPQLGRRDDYALAAGSDDGSRPAGAIGRGTASINWAGVPPHIFDAAEDTVDWGVQADGAAVVAVVRTAVIGPGPATGVAVGVRSGPVSGSGELDVDGHATVPLLDAQQVPITESAAWNHDWLTTSVVVGAEVSETRDIRERARRWARARLDRPADDAFLAEVLASEAAY